MYFICNDELFKTLFGSGTWILCLHEHGCSNLESHTIYPPHLLMSCQIFPARTSFAGFVVTKACFPIKVGNLLIQANQGDNNL
jgi:hypothetical protein